MSMIKHHIRTNMKNDIYNVWNGKKFVFTLGKICEILGTELPEVWKKSENREIKHFGYKTIIEKANDNGILFDAKPQKSRTPSIIEAAGRGVFIVSNKEYIDSDGNPVPTIKADGRDAWIALGKYIKEVFPMPTIGITGSVGKTTTTMFADCVFSEKFNVFVSGRNGKNWNGPRTIVQQMIRRYGPEYDIHIQECGGGSPNLIEGLAEMLTVDAFGITTIDTFHHIDAYKTADNIIADKTSFDKHANPDAICVVNLDDEILRKYPFKCRKVTFAVNDKTADYVGRNIIQNGAYLEFDVDDHKKLVHISIEIAGTHNVYNALMVFAFAREFGLTDEQIVKGFAQYSSSSIRQSIKNISGRKMYIDCFNVCSESIKSCCTTLQGFDLAKGAKKIAVIGGENALGDSSYTVNYDTGASLGEYNDIDEFYFIGPKEPATAFSYNYYGNGKAVYEGAKTTLPEEKLHFVDDLGELADIIKDRSKPGDAILFKGIFRLPLFAAIDRAFGTSYVINNANFKGDEISSGSFTGTFYPEIDGINITKFKGKYSNLTIPGQLGDKRLSRIDGKAFSGKLKLEELTIEEGILTIGERAFSECKHLKRVTVPKSVIRIENNAFSDCYDLEEIELLGAEDIGPKAFKNCKNLKRVILSESCNSIADDAFDGCNEGLVIVAPKKSYAEEYAKNMMTTTKNKFFKGVFFWRKNNCE